MKDIYKLKLHDTCSLQSDRWGDIEIIRVPGGWLYDYTKFTSAEDELSPLAKAVVFVPFNNEFQQKK